MENNKLDRNSLTEVYVILTELELYEKIPNELKEFINENKNPNYDFKFNKKMPLFNQVTNVNTRILLSYLYTKYICNSNEKVDNILKDLKELLDK